MKSFSVKEINSKKDGIKKFNFDANVGVRFHPRQRKIAFKGVIVYNKNLGCVTVYRNRNTRGNAMFQNNPSTTFINTTAGERIYNAFRKSAVGSKIA